MNLMGRSITQYHSSLNDTGASLFLLMRSFGKLRYAGLNERFQKGPFWLYTEGWNRSLSFATRSTYLLGRRFATLRPAFMRGMRLKEV